MTTKSYLAQMMNIDRRIMDKLSEAEKWMDIAFGRSIGKSKQIKHDTIQESRECNDKIADAIAKSVDYYYEALQMSKTMVETKHTIESQIASIQNDKYYNVLHDYYIGEKTLSEIAIDESVSCKSIKRRYEAAIKCFEDEFGKNYL